MCKCVLKVLESGEGKYHEDSVCPKRNCNTPIFAMDSAPISKELNLQQDKLRKKFVDSENKNITEKEIKEKIERLVRYVEAARRIINSTNYGWFYQEFADKMEQAEPKLGELEFNCLQKLGIMGIGEGASYVSCLTVYINIDSDFFKEKDPG